MNIFRISRPIYCLQQNKSKIVKFADILARTLPRNFRLKLRLKKQINKLVEHVTPKSTRSFLRNLSSNDSESPLQFLVLLAFEIDGVWEMTVDIVNHWLQIGACKSNLCSSAQSDFHRHLRSKQCFVLDTWLKKCMQSPENHIDPAGIPHGRGRYRMSPHLHGTNANQGCKVKCIVPKDGMFCRPVVLVFFC